MMRTENLKSALELSVQRLQEKRAKENDNELKHRRRGRRCEGGGRNQAGSEKEFKQLNLIRFPMQMLHVEDAARATGAFPK